MLQQTQVATVIPYFKRWMATFPTMLSLAQAHEQDVLAAWQGLGYYRRARLLHTGAQAMCQSNELPTSASQWRGIPGVGAYTAGAIASIAYNEPAALVDGNVERVFARLTLNEANGAALNKAAWDWAGAMIHQNRPGDWNQALMELGATVCKPIDPQCDRCPASNLCEACKTGRQTQLPTPTPKPKTTQLVHHIWIPVCQGKFGVRQIPSGQWWRGMWEFPRSEDQQELADLFGKFKPDTIGSFRHSVTQHRILAKVSHVRLDEPLAFLTWQSLEDLKTIPMPAPQRKALAIVVNRLNERSLFSKTP